MALNNGMRKYTVVSSEMSKPVSVNRRFVRSLAEVNKMTNEWRQIAYK
jgi:hypothetical protein